MFILDSLEADCQILHSFAHIYKVHVTRVNQDHLYSVIQLILGRTESSNTFACITTAYYALPRNAIRIQSDKAYQGPTDDIFYNS